LAAAASPAAAPVARERSTRSLPPSSTSCSSLAGSPRPAETAALTQR
jgi:hypothetical protein